jgi:hypothetical protein
VSRNRQAAVIDISCQEPIVARVFDLAFPAPPRSTSFAVLAGASFQAESEAIA